MIDVKYNEVKDRNSWIDGNYLVSAEQTENT